MKSHNVTQVVIYTSQKLIKPRLTPNAILVTCIQSYILTLQRLVVKTFEYFHTLPATVVFALFSRYMSSTCHIRLPHQYFILPKLSHSHAQSVYIWFLYLFILFSVFFSKCNLGFLLVMQKLCCKKEEKADNDDGDHHYQVNYFIITVALKISSCNKIAWRPLTQIMQRCKNVYNLLTYINSAYFVKLQQYLFIHKPR